MDKQLPKGVDYRALFPCPEQPSYTSMYFQDSDSGYVFSIGKKTCSFFLPSLSEDQKHLSSKALIYFHGNGYDMNVAAPWLQAMRDIGKFNVFANQYPGYGIYTSRRPSPELVESEAQCLYDFVRGLGFDQKDIIVVGRSIGSGPACHLAASRNCGTLVLVSPFFDITDLLKYSNEASQAYYKQSFPNKQNILKMKARLMVIHGVKDPLFKIESIDEMKNMYEKDLGRNDGRFLFHKQRTHSYFNLMEDIIHPLKEFIGEHNAYDISADSTLQIVKQLQINGTH